MSDKSATLSDRVLKLEVDVKDIKKDLEALEHLKQADIENRTRFEYIIKSLEELKTDVKSITTGKPNKILDTITAVILTAIITGVVAHFMHL